MQKYPDELKDRNFATSLLIAIGSNYMLIDEFEQATYFFKRALDVKPSNFQAFVYLGQCYHLQEDNEMAMNYLKKALDMEPDYSNFEYENLYVVIGQIFLDSAQADEDEIHNEDLINAMMAFTKSLMYLNTARRNSDSDNSSAIASTLMQIGKIYFMLSDYIHALVNFQLAYEMDDEIPQVNLFLTLSYLYLGMGEDALTHYEQIPEEEHIKWNYRSLFPALEIFNMKEGGEIKIDDDFDFGNLPF
jgi:tetratricopeptide (TPR) repeat protein